MSVHQHNIASPASFSPTRDFGVGSGNNLIGGLEVSNDVVKQTVAPHYQRKSVHSNSGDSIIIMNKKHHTEWKKQMKLLRKDNFEKPTVTKKEKNDIHAYCLMIMMGEHMKKHEKKQKEQKETAEETMTSD